MKRFRFERFLYFFLSLLLLPTHFVFATELSSVYAVPTTHLTSASANYKFYLTLNGSASWVGGETMTIAFPSGYSLTSFTEDDADVAVASVDFTTAANCGGTEQMGISFSGTAVTFEMCTGDGGSVSSGSVVEIELGLNASSSGTGTHQVTNPSGAGSYFLAISGTFGADGSVIVPITASSGSGVSVTVPDATPVGGADDECTVACDGGGDGGDPTTPDSDPTTDPDPIPDTDPDPIPDTDPDPTSDPTPDTDPIPDPGNGGDSDSSAPSDDSGSGGEDLSYDVGVSAEDISLFIIDNTVSVIAESSADLEIIFEDGNPTSVYIEIDGELYPLTEVEDGVWRGDVSIGIADSLGTIIVEDNSGQVATSPLTLDVVSSGIVYEVVDGQSAGVAGATVTVLNLDGSIWNADAYGQSASVITGSSGSGFAWYVPNGTYIVRVEKEGYETSETTVTVTRNILAPTLFVSRGDEDVPVVTGETETPDEGVEETPEETIVEPIEEAPGVVAGIVENIFAVFEDVTPEEAAVVATPVAIATAVLATAAVGGSQLWLLLYSFLSQPFLFFTRKKHRKVGIVYNSVTKIPLDLVTVRAYNVQTNRLVKTVVTNEKGEFFLRLSEEGTYRLQATKQGFVFPSTYLGDVKEDGAYLDVYAGQDIVLSKDAEPLTVSIPLDPVGSPVPARALKWERTKRRIAFVLSPLSVLVSLGVFIVYASVFTGILLAAQILLYALTWRVTHKKRKQTWGIVYDESTRRPVGNVVIRLFEPKYNKLVDSLISDANGRYVFALGPNEYYVTFAKDGYLEATVKPVDFRSRKDISLFGINLPLRRHDGAAHE